MRNQLFGWKTTVGLLAILWMSHSVLAGTIIYVDPQAAGDNDGSNWASAYICLQNALEVAVAGDEIRVAQGTYKPDRRTVLERRSTDWDVEVSGDVTATFSLPDGVVVEGGYAGGNASDPNARDVETHPSILSGDLNDNDIDLADLQSETLFEFVTHSSLTDNAHIVVTANDVSAETVLDGFIITGGCHRGGSLYSYGRSRTGIPLPAPSADTDGAGAYIRGGSPTFKACTFYRNAVQSLDDNCTGGAGVLLDETSAVLQNCTFEENFAFGYDATAVGGALLNFNSTAQIINCTFVNNVTAGLGGDYVGGAVANVYSSSTFSGCTFVANQAIDSEGGAMYNSSTGDVQLVNCAFLYNTADNGGAVYSDRYYDVTMTGCVLLANEATSFGNGGALCAKSSESTLFNCRFLGHTGAYLGGAVYSEDILTIVNCEFSGNAAGRGGAVYGAADSRLSVLNSTFTANAATEDGGAYYGYANPATFTNCILWNDAPQEVYSPTSTEAVVTSNIQTTREPEEGNLNADPRFRDALGADGVAGTLDDDLHLILVSPCIDAGSNTAVPDDVTTDLDDGARIVNSVVDMGAYEFDGPYNYYVDVNDGNDAFGGYSPTEAFATIQRGIEAAPEGYTVVVLPGLYTEEINFDGKAITVAGSEGGVVLASPDGYGVSFYTAEDNRSVLKNFVIESCDVGIFIAGASPTIQNVTLANNQFGVTAYAGASPDITSCILWDNIDGDLFGCHARYSCVQDGSEGMGNIYDDPLFADAEGGDYHLLAEEGRYVSAYGLWSFDEVTSPCIDAGDFLLDIGHERMPNGGRINMGAFGGTPEASLSAWPLEADINRDGVVDDADLDILYEQWEQNVLLVGEDITDAGHLSPNPATWEIGGEPREVQGTGAARRTYFAEMTAAEVFSPYGGVQYCFECQESVVQASGWQTERTYSTTKSIGASMHFRVRARDLTGQMTEWSEWTEVILLEEY